jgi:predicted peroxiredoxin
LAILVWGAEPEAPQRCATPFYFAATAAAFDADVEMYFTARAVELLRAGVAETLRAAEGDVNAAGKTVAHFLREAAALGVKMFACPTAMAAQGLPGSELRREVTGQAGAAAYIGRTLDPGWRTLTF